MLEASVAVCSDETLDEFSILEKLSSLASKSLVVVDFREETQRYRLLESLRQYGLERLKQRGEFDVVARRHAEYFAQHGRQLRELWRTTPELRWYEQIDAELDNIRAAIDWSLAQRNNPMLGAALAENLWPFWMSRAVLEGKRWFEKAQAEAGLSANPALSLAISLAMTRIMITTARKDLLAATEQALAAARALGDEPMLARAIFYHGEALLLKNRLDEAEPLLMESLELARRIGDRLRTGASLHLLGEVNRKRGLFGRARELMSQGLQLEDASGRNRALSIIDLSYLEKLEDNLPRAAELAQEALRVCEQLKASDIGALAENQLALYHLELGQLNEASAHARAALKVCHDERLSSQIPWSIEVLAGVALRQGAFERGARLIGYAGVAAVQTGRELDAQEQKDLSWLTQPLRDHFNADILAKLAAEGAAWSEDQAVEEALMV